MRRTLDPSTLIIRSDATNDISELLELLRRQADVASVMLHRRFPITTAVRLAMCHRLFYHRPGGRIYRPSWQCGQRTLCRFCDISRARQIGLAYRDLAVETRGSYRLRELVLGGSSVKGMWGWTVPGIYPLQDAWQMVLDWQQSLRGAHPPVGPILGCYHFPGAPWGREDPYLVPHVRALVCCPHALPWKQQRRSIWRGLLGNRVHFIDHGRITRKPSIDRTARDPDAIASIAADVVRQHRPDDFAHQVVVRSLLLDDSIIKDTPLLSSELAAILAPERPEYKLPPYPDTLPPDAQGTLLIDLRGNVLTSSPKRHAALCGALESQLTDLFEYQAAMVHPRV